MKDQTRQSNEGRRLAEKSGRAGIELKADDDANRLTTPSDKGTPRVDQGHNSPKTAGQGAGPNPRSGRDADTDDTALERLEGESPATPGRDTEDDEFGDQADDSSKTMKPLAAADVGNFSGNDQRGAQPVQGEKHKQGEKDKHASKDQRGQDVHAKPRQGDRKP